MARILVDVTRMLQSGLHTGIQRVVRRLYAGLLQEGPARGWQVIPVTFAGAHWRALANLPNHPLEGVPESCGVLADHERRLLKPGNGDIILLADASWHLNPWPAVDAALARGAVLMGMVHDLLPLQRPDWFSAPLEALFRAHLRRLLTRADQLIVPSRYVRQQVRTYLNEFGCGVFANETPGILLLPHGADFCRSETLQVGIHLQAGDRSAPTPFFLFPPGCSIRREDLFLSVGTLEPRKNHGLLLDAFEHLWARGGEQHLLLVGGAGWGVESLLARLADHPQRGRRLFHLTGLTDPELAVLYGRVRAMIYLSRDEGFGLPVAEAAYQGCPVIAADVPALREAGQGWPTYLRPDDLDGLIDALMAPPPKSNVRPQRTWSQAAADFFASLSDEVSPPTLSVSG